MKILKRKEARIKKGKTILILGNGFDLAHGLPTKYSQFLDFCQRVNAVYCREFNKDFNGFKREWLDGWEADGLIKGEIQHAFMNREIKEFDGEFGGKFDGCYMVICHNQKLEQIHRLIFHNIWYSYFNKLYKTNCMAGENWIDFEFEIRFIISEIDKNVPSLTRFWDDVVNENTIFANDQKIEDFNEILESDMLIQLEKEKSHQITVRDIRERLFKDLQDLTKALEWYLTEYVEEISISVKIPEISNLTPDYVINFNYTNTYERIYGIKEVYQTHKQEKYCQLFGNGKIPYLHEKEEVYHIHGKANKGHSNEDNNMVLGIDEYWSENERDERTNFTIFKKFAQRIQKHTGNESYRYLEEMQNLFKERENRWPSNVDRLKRHSDGVSYVYIFGHSLDVTDKDILSSFIGDDSTSVTIYCMDKGTEGELIANTIKMIGEKRLLEKSNHVPTKLNYVIQEHQTYTWENSPEEYRIYYHIPIKRKWKPRKTK